MPLSTFFHPSHSPRAAAQHFFSGWMHGQGGQRAACVCHRAQACAHIHTRNTRLQPPCFVCILPPPPHTTTPLRRPSPPQKKSLIARAAAVCVAQATTWRGHPLPPFPTDTRTTCPALSWRLDAPWQGGLSRRVRSLYPTTLFSPGFVCSPAFVCLFPPSLFRLPQETLIHPPSACRP